jgi:hypothetical protein
MGTSNYSDEFKRDAVQQIGPAPVSFRSSESDTRHQGDWIWQRDTATSSNGMRFGLDLPGKSGEHQLRNQEVFYEQQEQTDSGVSA